MNQKVMIMMIFFIFFLFTGMPGMTAYAGFYEVGRPKKGVLGLFSLAHEESPSNKAQNPSHCFLLTCDTRVSVDTRFLSSHQHFFQNTIIEERKKQKRVFHQLPFFTTAAQKSINPQRLNHWIVPIF